MADDLQVKLYKEKDRRLRQMPEIIQDFIYSLDTSTSIRTQIAYLKDYTVFLEFLVTMVPEFIGREINSFSPSDFDKLTERDIRDFLSYLAMYRKSYKNRSGKEITQVFTNSPKGLARKLASLHTLFNWMSKRKYIKNDPTKHVEIKIKEKQEIRDRLYHDDLAKFLNIIINDVNVESAHALKFQQRVKFRDYIIVLILGFTGIRISELVQLNVSDISIEHKVMVVTRKGGNQAKIYIPEEIIPDLSKYLEERKKITDVETMHKDALFLSLQKKRINDRTVRYMLKKYKERSNIDIEKITPHTFRRSFATMFYNKTRDIELTRDVLGHSSVETTRKFYADSTEERKREAMRSFSYDNLKQEKNIELTKSKLQKLAEKTGISVEELLAEIAANSD